MSLFDKIRKNATKVVDQHGDKISRGLDTVAEKVDKRTGGKHSDKITKGVSKAKEGLDRLDSKRDHDLGGPGTTPPGTTPPSTPPQSGPGRTPGTDPTPPR
jgi:hypothetical protein